MDLLKPVDLYCERIGTGILAEPLNLVSNLMFVLCGLMLLAKARKSPHKSNAVLIGWLIILVGIGSGLFHAFANNWSQWADIIPIVVLVIVYIYIFGRDVLGLSTLGTVSFYELLFLSSFGFIWLIPSEAVNGSNSYFGVALTMGIIGIVDLKLRDSKKVLFATALFACSLTFRSIDNGLCYLFSSGTHFLWHILNALMLYLLGFRLLSNTSKPPEVKG